MEQEALLLLGKGQAEPLAPYVNKGIVNLSLCAPQETRSSIVIFIAIRLPTDLWSFTVPQYSAVLFFVTFILTLRIYADRWTIANMEILIDDISPQINYITTGVEPVGVQGTWDNGYARKGEKVKGARLFTLDDADRSQAMMNSIS